MNWPSFGGGKRQCLVKTMQMYAEKPQGEISMEEFERFSLDRRNVLKGIERGHAMGLKRDEMKAMIDKLLGQYLPERSWDEAQLAEDRRKDYLSHHFLCLMYSRSEEKQRWLLKHEDRLFKHRFNALSAEGRGKAMGELRGADWKGITEEEYAGLKDRLMAVFGGRNMNLQENSYSSANAEYFHKIEAPWTHIYKVPFEDVIDLVRGRQVFLQHGYAYVLSRDLDAIASDSFCKLISRKLKEYKEKLPDIVYEEDERLGPLLMALPDAHASGPFTAEEEGSMALSELPVALAESAPLCMRSSYDVLKTQHHLKHHARLQFGLFLKGIGLKMEDALAFWKTEFARGGKTADEFEKRYSYNFQHQYGQVGARKNYRPYACGQIIGASPDTSGATGCPFKICKPADLEKKLGAMGLNKENVAAVVGKAKERHFQVACTMTFEAREGRKFAEGGVLHPNQYFNESRKNQQGEI
jgi:DNA primase large subunit